MILTDFPIEPRDVPGRMDWALLCLQDPPDDNAVLGVVLAIRSLAGTYFHPDRDQAAAEAVQSAANALLGLGEQVATEATPMDRAFVLAGIQAAVRVLGLFGVPDDVRITEAAFQQVLNDLDHAVLLTDELSATLRRRSIAARAAAGHRPCQPAPYSSAGGALH